MHDNNKDRDRNHTLICAYAPTLPNSEKKPEIRDKFYKDLESAINGVSKRNILYIAGISMLRQDPDTRTTPKM